MTLLDNVVAEMHARVKELRPAVEEYERLVEALGKLNGIGGEVVPSSASSPFKAKLTVANNNMAKVPSAKKRGRGRPKGGSQDWSAKVFDAIQITPGKSASELTALLGIKQGTYIHRVLNALALDGKIVKEGKRWYPR